MKRTILFISLFFAVVVHAVPTYETKLGVPADMNVLYSSGRFVEVDWQGKCILNIANTGNTYTQNSFFRVLYQKLSLYAQKKYVVLDFEYAAQNTGLTLVDFVSQDSKSGGNKNLSGAIRNEKLKHILGCFDSYDKDNQTFKIGSYVVPSKIDIKYDAKIGELLNKEIPSIGYMFGYYTSKDDITLTLEHYFHMGQITNKLQSDYVANISLYAKNVFLNNLTSGWYPDEEKLKLQKQIPVKKKSKIFAVEGGADLYCNLTFHDEDISLLYSELPNSYCVTLEYKIVDDQFTMLSATDISMESRATPYLEPSFS